MTEPTTLVEPRTRSSSGGVKTLSVRSRSRRWTRRQVSPAGLELGERSIAVAQLERGLAPARFRRGFLLHLAESCRFGEPASLGAWVAALRDVRSANRWRGREVVASLPGLALDVLPLSLEGSDRTSRLVDLRRQATERLPYPVTEAVVDTIAIDGQEADAGPQRVILIATRRALVDFALEALEEAGFQPLALEIAATALARLHRHMDPDPSCGALVVCPSDTATSIAYIREGHLLVTRVIPWGTSLLVERLEGALRVGAPEAWRLLRSYRLNAAPGVPGDSGPERVSRVLGGLVAPLLEDLLIEVEKVWDYAATEFRRTPPERILVAGNAAFVPALEEVLAGQLGRPVSVLDPSRQFAWTATAPALGNVPPPAALAVATGLAIRGDPCPAKN